MHAIGVDAIKLIYADQAHTGRPPVQTMQPEVMRAIIEEAHRLGVKAYVHAPGMRQAKEVFAPVPTGWFTLSRTRLSTTSSSR